jgi:hypothetical protein
MEGSDKDNLIVVRGVFVLEIPEILIHTSNSLSIGLRFVGRISVEYVMMVDLLFLSRV